MEPGSFTLRDFGSRLESDRGLFYLYFLISVLPVFKNQQYFSIAFSNLLDDLVKSSFIFSVAEPEVSR